MKSFLEYVAHDVLEKYGHDLSRLAMVFPNKRASLFFNEHLARLAGRPVWSPAYITISDLFRSHSTLQTGDPIKLVCDLHKCFVQVTGIQESLDHFYGWGQVLLADFDDIDKNMADASKVFANLRDLHELDDVSYLTEEQKAIIRKFFGNFSDEQQSELKQRFLKLWSHFIDIYHSYNDYLEQQGLAYEGALYKKVATDETVTFEHDAYLFVGFNLIQPVEQLLFRRLKKEGKARFYWDFDHYYLQSSKLQVQRITRLATSSPSTSTSSPTSWTSIAMKSTETSKNPSTSPTFLPLRRISRLTTWPSGSRTPTVRKLANGLR